MILRDYGKVFLYLIKKKPKRKQLNNMDTTIKVILIYGFISIAYEFLKIKIIKKKVRHHDKY